MSETRARTMVRLVFADRGTFHVEIVDVPLTALDRYERLIDLLREEPEVARVLHIDPRRIVAAHVVDDAQEGR